MPDTHLVDAVLYGRLNGVPPEMVFLFARTGLIHLFSASGFHMAMALIIARGIAWAASRALPHPRAPSLLAFGVSLGMMVFFGAKTDWSSPMVRAFTFSALFSLATLLEVRAARTHVFLLSLVTAALLGRGSWLSFALSATGMAALLLAYPRNFFTLALAPWAASLPLVTWYFQLFSGAAPFWNVTVGAFIGITVLPIAIVHLLLASLGLELGFLLRLAEWIMKELVLVLAWGDRWVGLSFWVAPGKFLAVAAPLLGAVALAKWSKTWAGLVALGAVAVAVIYPEASLASLRVGQGDATFFRLASGARVLVDTGPPGFRGRESGSARSAEALSLGYVDDLFFSHLDRDHVGGTASFLGRHPVRGAAWLREEHLEDPKAIGVLAALERAGVPLKFYSAEPRPGLRCWLPPATGSNESSAFCHARLANGNGLWLTGDAGFPSERWLLEQGPLPQGEFLKVAHHGSRFSSGPDFLRALGARTALVSVGKNRYGHPAPAAMERLREAGMKVHRTDLEGSLVYW